MPYFTTEGPEFGTCQMQLERRRRELGASVVVESKNTGRHWRLSESEAERFFTGRRREAYRVYREEP